MQIMFNICMKIGLYENYKFTNLFGGGGGVKLNLPGHTETKKLRGSIKELGGGGGLASPRQFAPCRPVKVKELIKQFYYRPTLQRKSVMN